METSLSIIYVINHPDQGCAGDHVETQPIDIMAMPTPEPTPSRPKSTDSVGVHDKRKKYLRADTTKLKKGKKQLDEPTPTESTEAPLSRASTLHLEEADTPDYTSRGLRVPKVPQEPQDEPKDVECPAAAPKSEEPSKVLQLPNLSPAVSNL